MKFLLDTNILSELRRLRGNRGVHVWAQTISTGDFATSIICLLEIERGAYAVQRSDPPFSAALLKWLDELRRTYAERILLVDETVASRCARLLYPKTPQLADALIAATALAHGLTIVTHNVRHFEPLGVALLDPWLT